MARRPLQVYIDQSSWGMLMDFTGEYTSHFRVLGDVFSKILKYVAGRCPTGGDV